MSEKMPERTKAVIVNISIAAGLLLCNFRGYPLKIILLSGLFIFAFANVLMYLKRRRTSKRPTTYREWYLPLIFAAATLGIAA